MKYKLTDETMTTDSGIILHRIECVTAFADVKKKNFKNKYDYEDDKIND